MKKSFSGYYRPSEDEFSILWKEGVFILDANVLLNLYRYSKETRDDLIKILEKLSGRLWIPYQAALEYQENRLSVIAQQVERYSDVRKILSDTQNNLSAQLDKLQLKRRHPSIDPDDLLGDVKRVFEDLRNYLEGLEQCELDVLDHDVLRDKIDQILEGRVGPPPDSQACLDKIYKEGETRYKQKRPPGYMDAMKESKQDEREAYVYGGLVFERKYGDLILWEQIIKEVKAREDLEHVIFITDDSKEDWWWKVKSRGEKTIGPRPELIDEISSEAGVSLFYMYNSERFITFAKQYLEVEIKKESIDQVRGIMQAIEIEAILHGSLLTSERRKAIINLIKEDDKLWQEVEQLIIDAMAEDAWGDWREFEEQ